jgi:bacillopeptidase F (M6 metalloprotease family)
MSEDDYYTHVQLNVVGSLKAITPERLAQLLQAESDLAAARALLADAEIMLQECGPWLDQYANTAKLKADTHKVRLRIVDALAGKDAK